MSRAILCLAFVTALASIGNGRVIEKRSPGVALGNKVVGVANDVGDTFVDAGSAVGDFSGNLGKTKRSPWMDCDEAGCGEYDNPRDDENYEDPYNNTDP